MKIEWGAKKTDEKPGSTAKTETSYNI